MTTKWFCLTTLLLLLSGCSSPPQMGPDKDVFATVDALFTAITAHDAKQLQQCKQRLGNSHAAGTLPDSAHLYLTDIITTAEKGNWQSAAETLYSFMLAQRREGDRETKSTGKRKGGK